MTIFNRFMNLIELQNVLDFAKERGLSNESFMTVYNLYKSKV